MENIGKFLDAMDRYGVASFEKFQTVDLYEGQNMTQVVISLHAIARKVISLHTSARNVTSLYTSVLEM